jgi:hypothetical protein
MGLLLLRYRHEFHPDLPVAAFYQLEVHDGRILLLGRAIDCCPMECIRDGLLFSGCEVGLSVYLLPKEDLPAGIG